MYSNNPVQMSLECPVVEFDPNVDPNAGELW